MDSNFMQSYQLRNSNLESFLMKAFQYNCAIIYVIKLCLRLRTRLVKKQNKEKTIFTNLEFIIEEGWS